MLQETQPAPLGDAGVYRRWSEFRITHPREITALLRQVRDGSVPVHLSAPGGSALTTSLWAIDSALQRLNFSAGDGSPQLQSLIDADETVAVAYLDSVKLQFDLHGLMLVRGASGCALHAELPREVYRFQRRGGYRVRPGGRQSPQAHFHHPSLPDIALTLRMLDVSIGGCALQLPGDMPPLQPGTRIGDVRIELDAATAFSVMLVLQHVSSVQGQGNDGGGFRLGCEWGPISGDAQRALQRWIDDTQKRRRLLPLGRE